MEIWVGEVKMRKELTQETVELSGFDCEVHKSGHAQM